MRALPYESWRNFARYLVLYKATLKSKNGRYGHGAITKAYKAAGFAPNGNSKWNSIGKNAHNLSHDERILAAAPAPIQQCRESG